MQSWKNAIRLDFAVLLLQFFLLLGFSLASSFYINHDAALYLQCGQLIIGGATPYVDFYDNNPPLVMWLSMIPVIASKSTGLPVYLCFSLCMVTTISAMTILIHTIQRSFQRPIFERLIFSSAWLFMHSIILVLHAFGQREHWFVTLATPYLLLRTFQAEDTSQSPDNRLRAATGFMAAIGTMLKPHFILTICVLEFALQFRKPRSAKEWPLEIIGFMAFALIYAIVFQADTRLSRNYLGTIAPLVSRGNHAYTVDFFRLIAPFHPGHNHQSRLQFVILSFFLTSLFIQLLRTKTRSRPALAFSIVSIFSFGSYFYQAKGWEYHLIPFLFWSLLLGVFILQDCSEKMRSNRLREKQMTLFIIFVVASISALLQTRYLKTVERPNSSWNPALYQFLTSLPDDAKKVTVISTSMVAYPSMIQANKEPGSRFLWFFPFALLYSNAHGSDGIKHQKYNRGTIDESLETRFLNELSADIATNNAEAILLNADSQDLGLPPEFSIGTYLKEKNILPLIQSKYNHAGELKFNFTGQRFQIWRLKPGSKEPVL